MKTCPACGFESPPEMAFCGMCGARLALVCPECQFGNPLDFRFCGRCGTPLPDEKPPVGAQRAPVGTTPPIYPSLKGETLAPPPPSSREPLPPAPEPVASPLLAGERRVATIVLADVKGSTDLLEEVGTERWVEIMNRLFQVLEGEIYRFGGKIDQFRGDGLVAFFGATAAHEDDPERAVLAGLAMQEALEAYAAELAEAEGVNLQLRVGVNTGEVIVTSVGERAREDTAMGEAIAIAARMETAAQPGTVLVSESTYRLVPTEFEWMPLGEINVKGISQPIEVYRPVMARVDVDHLEGAYNLNIPLIGREEEFQALKSGVEDLLEGRGGIAVVTGERGMGKSFLVSEVRNHFVRQGALLAEVQSVTSGEEGAPPNLTWLRGRTRSYDQGAPYAMWLNLLQKWLDIPPDEPREQTRDRLRARSEALWGEGYVDYYPYLAAVLSLPLQPSFAERLSYLDGEGMRRAFFQAVYAWILALAQEGPLVIAFSDMHWADLASLDLLEYCLPLSDSEPLLWLLVFREERDVPTWGLRYHLETEYPHRLTTVTVPPLDEEQSVVFIRRLIGGEALSTETRSLVVEKAEGNPYYIKELIHALIAQGVLVQEGGRWRASREVTTLDLPDSLQGLLLARIDRLTPEERHVLQIAAVIGSVFWSNALRALVDDVDVQTCLTELQRSQLIVERGRVPDLGMEYSFKSALVRDAAYSSLLRPQRAKYHRRVAHYLEGLVGEGDHTEYSGALAYHYGCASEEEKELQYVLVAARGAQAVYANAEALSHYTHALEIVDVLVAEASREDVVHDEGAGRREHWLRRKFQILNARREVFSFLGDFEAGWSDARTMLWLAYQMDDPELIVDALLQQRGVRGWDSREELEEGLGMAQQALDLAREQGNRHQEMYALGSIAAQRYTLLDPSWEELAQQALDLARELEDRRYEVTLLTGVGNAYAWVEPQRSVQYLQEALPIVHMLEDKQAELGLLGLIGTHLEASVDYYGRLKECHEQQLEISREIGNRPEEANALMWCSQIEGIYLGDLEAGLELRNSLHQVNRRNYELFALLRIVQMLILQGRYAQAEEMLGRAWELSEGALHDMGRVGVRLVSMILYNALGDEIHLREALRLGPEVMDIFAGGPLATQYRMVAQCQMSAAHLGLARCLGDEGESRGHLEAALKASEAALRLYEETGYVRPVEATSEEVLYRHSMALRANGRNEEAADYLARAYKEMMHKHDLIPAGSHYRRTFLENIPLHREIRMAHAASSARFQWDGSKVRLQFDE